MENEDMQAEFTRKTDALWANVNDPDKCREVVMDTASELNDRLQDVFDGCPPEDWDDAFAKLATERELVYERRELPNGMRFLTGVGAIVGFHHGRAAVEVDGRMFRTLFKWSLLKKLCTDAARPNGLVIGKLFDQRLRFVLTSNRDGSLPKLLQALPIDWKPPTPEERAESISKRWGGVFARLAEAERNERI